MREADLRAITKSAEAQTGFAARTPSRAWERIAAPDNPHHCLWAWFKPPNVPPGVILRIPDEMYRVHPKVAESWTVRKLLHAVGVDPAAVATCFVYGMPCNLLNGGAWLDARIPRPTPGADPNIVVYINPALIAAVPVATGPMDEATLDIFERIDADWSAISELDKDLGRLRKQLVDMMGRLKNLNRDLTNPERLHSTSQDKKDWQDCRRGLRDATNRLWKCIKANDIGETSTAGQKAWFEETHRKYIAPRKCFDGLAQALRAFDTYRKMVQTLHTDMTNAYNLAMIDGERKAQSVLARIQAKVREATNRKNFLGVILDS
jgi:hypothetical protein